MSASTQVVPSEHLTGDEMLYLEVFVSVDNCQKRVLPQHIMNLAMKTIHGWGKKQSEAVCRSLIEKKHLYRHSRRRIGNVPEQPRMRKSGFCAYCHRFTKRLTIDHIVPRSKGGSDEDWNRIDCCENCNLSKGDRDPVEWARDILNYLKPLKSEKPRPPINLRIKLAASLVLSFFGGLLR